MRTHTAGLVNEDGVALAPSDSTELHISHMDPYGCDTPERADHGGIADSNYGGVCVALLIWCECVLCC